MPYWSEEVKDLETFKEQVAKEKASTNTYQRNCIAIGDAKRSRSSLINCCCVISLNNFSKVMRMLSDLDEELTTEEQDAVYFILSEDIIKSDVYLVIDSDGRLNLSAENVLAGSYRVIYPEKNRNSNRTGLIYGTYVKLATQGLFDTFMEKLSYFEDVSGFSWQGENTFYCNATKSIVTKVPFSVPAEEALYGLYIPLYKYRLPEGGLDKKDLVRGRFYTRNRVDEEETGVIFKFNGDLSLHQDYCFRGSFHVSGYIITGDNRDYYFKPASTQEKREYRQGYEEYLQRLRERRGVERQLFLSRRKERLRRAKNNIDNYNKDVSTQLLSASLHECLTKALDNKVARCLLKLNKLGYLKQSTRNITIRRTDKLMTYMPAGKETVLATDSSWVSKGRQNGKYGKIIRKVLKEQVPRLKFTDQDIEQLVNHLKASTNDGDFSIVEGEDIRYWYHVENYWDSDGDETGTLGSSCMRDSQCQDWLDIYCKNDIVKMIVLLKDDLLIGRAILWDNKWVDRIYGTDSTIKAFKTFCKESGYHCKSSQNSDPMQGWINPETGSSYQESVVLSLKTDFDSFPYADTLCYIDRAGGVISNDYRKLNCYAEMRDTCGGLESDNSVYDEHDDCYIHEEDAVYIDSGGFSTHYNNATMCEISNQYYLNDDIISLYDGTSAAEDRAVWVSSCNQYAEECEVFHCEQSEDDYIEGYDGAEKVYIDELHMTVHCDYVEEAYEDNGYEFVDGEWSLSIDTKETSNK